MSPTLKDSMAHSQADIGPHLVSFISHPSVKPSWALANPLLQDPTPHPTQRTPQKSAKPSKAISDVQKKITPDPNKRALPATSSKGQAPANPPKRTYLATVGTKHSNPSLMADL